ncbi:hypothetical protein STENM223S_05595 [Streptomyces tendae]
MIGVLATAGMLLSQASYRGAGLAAPLATLTVVNPVVAAAVGITMFGETFRYGTTGTALALSCGVVAAGGLILLTTERLARSSGRRAGGGAGPVDAASARARAYRGRLLAELKVRGRTSPAGRPEPAHHGPLPDEVRSCPPAAAGRRLTRPARSAAAPHRPAPRRRPPAPRQI